MNNGISDKLKALRKAKRLTQQDVADAIGLQRSTISNYEIGRRSPSLHDLQRIAAYYGVSLDYFGIVSADDIAEIIARAREVFTDPEISTAAKDELYKELINPDQLDWMPYRGEN